MLLEYSNIPQNIDIPWIYCGILRDSPELAEYQYFVNRRFPISWYTKPKRGFLHPTIVELC